MTERQDLDKKKIHLTLYGEEISLIKFTNSNEVECSFLGPNGTYTEQATLDLLGNQAKLQPLSRITEVVEAVEEKKTDLGLVPIENSTEGNVVETIRSIIRSHDLSVLGEKVIPIHHMLLGNEKAFSKKIVRSHPQAIGQCTNWLKENLPGAEVITHNSTSEAVKTAAENDELGIGSSLAGEIYQIPILKENIEDLKGNTTRFWLIGRGETNPTDSDKTMLLFSLKNKVGLLKNSLAVFADMGINMTKIDSFPIGALDEYYFLLAIDGHAKDPKIAETLNDFQETCLKVRNLGSFHKSPIPDKYFAPNALLDGWLEPSE